MKHNISRNSKAQKKRRAVAMHRRAVWNAQHGKVVRRRKRKASHLLDLFVMPYFWIMDEFINTLRDIFNVR